VFTSASHINPLETYKAKVTLRPTVSRPVSHAFKPQRGAKTRFLLMSDGWEFFQLGRPRRREDGSVINCGHNQ
jgi:hypothetical protein